MTTPATVRWGRIVAGALLLEAALFAVLIPIGMVFGMPAPPGAGHQPLDTTVFFIAVPIACAVLGFLFGLWVARNAARAILHGALLGVVATIIYLAICSIPPSTISAAAAMYGAPLFVAVNGLRIVGCVAGAAYAQRRRVQLGAVIPSAADR